MTNFLGCLFILIFGAILFILGFARMLWQLLTGSGTTHNYTRKTYGEAQQQGQRAYHSSTSGNARHEGPRKNSRQRRSGKIFEKSEGTYVDFEEVKG